MILSVGYTWSTGFEKFIHGVSFFHEVNDHRYNFKIHLQKSSIFLFRRIKELGKKEIIDGESSAQVWTLFSPQRKLIQINELHSLLEALFLASKLWSVLPNSVHNGSKFVQQCLVWHLTFSLRPNISYLFLIARQCYSSEHYVVVAFVYMQETF